VTVKRGSIASSEVALKTWELIPARLIVSAGGIVAAELRVAKANKVVEKLLRIDYPYSMAGIKSVVERYSM